MISSKSKNKDIAWRVMSKEYALQVMYEAAFLGDFMTYQDMFINNDKYQQKLLY